MKHAYIEGTRPPTLRHEYKTDEWRVTREDIRSALQDYQGVYVGIPGSYYPDGWTDEAIWFFLYLHTWFYKEPEPEAHHFRYILTLIKEGALD